MAKDYMEHAEGGKASEVKLPGFKNKKAANFTETHNPNSTVKKLKKGSASKE